MDRWQSRNRPKRIRHSIQARCFISLVPIWGILFSLMKQLFFFFFSNYVRQWTNLAETTVAMTVWDKKRKHSFCLSNTWVFSQAGIVSALWFIGWRSVLLCLLVGAVSAFQSTVTDEDIYNLVDLLGHAQSGTEQMGGGGINSNRSD